jgi:hypothetical protein
VLDNRTEWLNILLEISEKVEAGIIIKDLSVEKKDKKIEIDGFAASRQDLLNFVQRLEDSENFENIILPSSYLINPTDIFFKLSLEISENQ